MQTLRSSTRIATVVFTLLTGLPLRAYEPIPRPDPNYTELHRAAESGHALELQAALGLLTPQRRAELLALPDREDMIPLSYAARTGSLECVQALLEAGSPLEVRLPHPSWTPLMQAAEQGHAAVVKCLLDHGADQRPRSWDGRNALNLALQGPIFTYGEPGDWRATVRVFLAHGADPEPLLDMIAQLERVAAERRTEGEKIQGEVERLQEEIRQLQQKLAAAQALLGPPGVRPDSN